MASNTYEKGGANAYSNDSGVQAESQTYQPSPIQPTSTGVSDLSLPHDRGFADGGHDNHQQETVPTATSNTTHHDIAPVSPPTYGEVIEERYGGDEKAGAAQPNAPQLQQPVMVTPLTALGREATMVDCPRCKQAVKTKIERHSGNRAFLSGALICLCVGCLCAWIPCVMDDCKDTEHSCSVCNLALATVTAGGAVELSAAARTAAQTASQHLPATNGQPLKPQPSQFAPSPMGRHTSTGSVPVQPQYTSPEPPRTQHQPGPVDQSGKPVPELGS